MIGGHLLPLLGEGVLELVELLILFFPSSSDCSFQKRMVILDNYGVDTTNMIYCISLFRLSMVLMSLEREWNNTLLNLERNLPLDGLVINSCVVSCGQESNSRREAK